MEQATERANMTGAGAVVKSFIRREQLKGPTGAQLQCAADVVNFLKANMSQRVETSYADSKKPMKRFFWHVLESDVQLLRNSIHACDSLVGTRKLHSVMATNVNNLTSLLVKELACFCEFCTDNTWDSCPNRRWTGAWTMKILQPQNTEFVRNQMLSDWDGLWSYGVERDLLAQTLDVGNNFAVNAARGNS